MDSELLVKNSNSIHKSKAITSSDELPLGLMSKPTWRGHPELKRSSFLYDKLIEIIVAGKLLQNPKAMF